MPSFLTCRKVVYIKLEVVLVLVVVVVVIVVVIVIVVEVVVVTFFYHQCIVLRLNIGNAIVR